MLFQEIVNFHKADLKEKHVLYCPYMPNQIAGGNFLYRCFL